MERIKDDIELTTLFQLPEDRIRVKLEVATKNFQATFYLLNIDTQIHRYTRTQIYIYIYIYLCIYIYICI